jgi:hypothetical protein
MLIRTRGALTLVSPAPSADLGGSTPGVAAWTAHASFNGPHAGIIRSAFWDEDAGILVSGGEDGTLCAWNCPPLDVADAEMEDNGGLGGRGVVREQSEEMDVDSPRAKRGRHDGAQVRLVRVFFFARAPLIMLHRRKRSCVNYDRNRLYSTPTGIQLDAMVTVVASFTRLSSDITSFHFNLL